MPHQQAAVQFCLKRGLLAVLPVGFGPILLGLLASYTANPTFTFTLMQPELCAHAW